MTTLDHPDFHEPLPDPSTKLTLEHQFYYITSSAMAEKATKEQLFSLFKTLLLSYLSQQEYYQALVKTTWGIDSGLDSRHTREERKGQDTED